MKALNIWKQVFFSIITWDLEAREFTKMTHSQEDTGNNTLPYNTYEAPLSQGQGSNLWQRHVVIPLALTSNNIGPDLTLFQTGMSDSPVRTNNAGHAKILREFAIQDERLREIIGRGITKPT